MNIEKHGFNLVVHNIAAKDEYTLTGILQIPHARFKLAEYGNARVLTHSFGKAKKSVYIRINSNNGSDTLRLELKGSFFDNSPDFSFEELLNFVASFDKWTPKQLDVAFNDDLKRLTKKDVKRWCGFSDDYCTGNLVKREPPYVVFRKRKFHRVQLGSAGSNTGYGTIYQRPDTKFLRIEIKIRDQKKIEYLLENFSKENIKQFEARSREMLVSCINFVTAQSKKNRVAAKYIKQTAWQSFLASKVKRIKWSEIRSEQQRNRVASEKVTFDCSISRQGRMVSKMIEGFKSSYPEANIIDAFAEYSGYRLVKDTKGL